MCRMLAVLPQSADAHRRVLTALRGQADRSLTGPDDHRSHRDGWGIAGLTAQGMGYLGRSPTDASRDPAYEAAIHNVGQLVPKTFSLAHVRNASVGGKSAQNTHPFVRDGWAFCHNGTVHDIGLPDGVATEGDTDSERLFHQILQARTPTESMTHAIALVVRAVDETLPYSSLTFLLTNGKELYAFRAVGRDPGSCGTRECALEHYALGVGIRDDAVVFTQEPQAFGALQRWSPIPDGSLVRMTLEGRIVWDPLLPDRGLERAEPARA